MTDTMAWLDARTGGERPPALQRGFAAMAGEDAQAEKAEGARLARVEDERTAKLTALRALGIGAGQVSMMGKQLQEAEARVDELRDELKRAEKLRDDKAGDWQWLQQQLGEAVQLATRSATATVTLDGTDLLERDRRQRQADAPLTAARACSALARIAELDGRG
jgi:hypothetical protein